MNKNKREVLKGLVAGSVWATPVVSSVVLPVHASTSESSGPCTEICITTAVEGAGGSEGGGGLTFHDSACSEMGTVSTGGPAPNSDSDCFDNLSPGIYSAVGSGGGEQGVTFTVTFQCCRNEFTVSQSGDTDSFYVQIEILSNGGCEYTALQTDPCTPP